MKSHGDTLSSHWQVFQCQLVLLYTNTLIGPWTVAPFQILQICVVRFHRRPGFVDEVFVPLVCCDVCSSLLCFECNECSISSVEDTQQIKKAKIRTLCCRVANHSARD